MKLTSLLLMTCLATSAIAGEVISPVPRKSALAVTKPFNRMNTQNVGVTAKITGRSVNADDATGKTIEVNLTGNVLGTVTVECLYVVESVPGTSTAGRQRILVGGQAVTNERTDSFQFKVGTLNESSKLKGWFVRVVEEGEIVGVAGSSEKYTTMAGDPATGVRYGEK